MANSNHFEQEETETIGQIFHQDSPVDLSFLPEIQNDSFLNNGHYNFENGINSPSPGDLPPSTLFSTLTNAVEEVEYTDILYIVNSTNGLEEADSSYLHIEVGEQIQKIDETETNVVPAKRQKKEMTLYEETLIKEFSSGMSEEMKLLEEEHKMRMKLWDLELQTSQEEHTLKMKILKEKLEKIQQEKQILQQERNAKYLGKFRSGPI